MEEARQAPTCLPCQPGLLQYVNPQSYPPVTKAPSGSGGMRRGKVYFEAWGSGQRESQEGEGAPKRPCYRERWEGMALRKQQPVDDGNYMVIPLVSAS